jgi:trigger factor
MQVTESNSDGLKRKLEVVVGASELAERFRQRLDEVKDRVEIKGFRKGKVPIAHLKKLYGRSLMSEVLQQTIRETSSKALAERKERPAALPDIALTEDKDEIEELLAGKSDLTYSMSFEVIPDIEVVDLSTLKLDKMVADVDDAAMDEALENLANRNTQFEAEEGRAAQTEDRVTIDFKGTLGGEAFDGGSGKDMSLVLGNANFIPGFEEGLVGVKTGDEKTIDATFPDAYPVDTLAGKEAQFAIKVKSVEKPKKPEINDEFAQGLGLEGKDKLLEMMREQIEKEHESVSYMQLKRSLLDALDESHSFELPPTLVDSEFNGIWAQVEERLKQGGKTFEDEGKTEESAREEYRKLSERRVRLALVIGEIGDANKIDVTQDELRQALMEQARAYPGQEKQVYEYFEKTEGAINELRAPIFEDKVVQHILSQANVTTKKVGRDELMENVKEA